MPRGKIVSPSNRNTLPAQDMGEKGADKKPSAKFTLISHDASDEHAHEAISLPLAELHVAAAGGKLNVKFTLLLLALFVMINLGLVLLLDNDKGKAVQVEAAAKSDATGLENSKKPPMAGEGTLYGKDAKPVVTPVSKPEIPQPAAPASLPAGNSRSGQDELISILNKL